MLKPYSKINPYNELPPLPPKQVDLESTIILKALSTASRNLGELKGLCDTLPDPQLLINTIVLQESRASSAIENIVTTQDELFKAALEVETASHAAKEVLSYRNALYAGLSRMQSQQNLIVTNTIIEIAQTIKQNDAGIRKTPGTSLKNAFNGEIIYTPPCCEDVIRDKLNSLEQFINDAGISQLDPLIKMPLIHYQFEAIHPFLDGNGRTGRILNALYLVQQGLLPEPVLYLSSYIDHYKSEYYRLLREVTEKENWQDWITYMLTAVAETAKLSTTKIRNMLLLKDELEVEAKRILGASYNHEILQLMSKQPYLKIDILEKAGIAHRQTASTWLKKLADGNILIPNKVGRTIYFVNDRLMKILAA